MRPLLRPRRARALRLAMIVLPSVIVLAAVGLTTAIAVSLQERSIREATTERVLDVATSLADLREVRDALAPATALGSPADLADAAELADATTALQPLADLVQSAAGVYYVVMTDDEGVRITHPEAGQRGVQVSTANASVLAGEPFVGTETGASGSSLRAKVPVRTDDGAIVGMVAVGVLESSIAAERDEAIAELLPWTVGALIAGTLASSLISAAVERRFRRADEIAAQQEQLRRTTAALREQSHEFVTKLHVVHGLVSYGDTREALDYIEGLAPAGSAVRERPAPAASTMLSTGVEVLRAEAAASGARLDAQIEPDVVVDDDLLLVLANLCRNAAEAGATRIRCSVRQETGRLIGSVADDGPGIDPRDAERVFAVGQSSKPDATGVGRGIGLDLVRRTVHERDGWISVDRSEWGGALFAFELTVRDE